MKQTKILLLALLFMVIPKNLWAYTKDQIVTFDNKTYKVLVPDGANASLMFVGTTLSGELVIPSKVNDNQGTTFTVTEVGEETNYDCKNVTSVKLPETIKKIGSGVFKDATLTKLDIPKSVEEISNTVWVAVAQNPECNVAPENPKFESDDKGVLYTKGKEELRTVPSNIMTKVSGDTYTVNTDVKSITVGAFAEAPNLKKIKLPAGLEKVGEEGWPSIASTSTLEAFEIDSGNANFDVVDGVLFTKGPKKLLLYPHAKNVTDYTVPAGVEEIASYGISRNKYITSIDLKDVTKVQISALVNLPKLKTITIPKNLKKAGLEKGAFEGCSALEAYKVAEGNTDFSAEDGVLFSADKTTLYFYPLAKPDVAYTIPNTVKVIADKSFQGAIKLTSLVIPTSVESINSQAFRQNYNLTSVTFREPSNITSLANYAFWSCLKLKEVTLPSSITKIGKAFLNCESLETINVPDGSKLEIIDEDAFKSNKNLKHFNFLGTCPLTTIKKNAFANLEQLKYFKIPKTVTNIELNAFSGCSNLGTVEFDPEADIEEIGEGAFADCGLQSISIPKKVTKIAKEAFRRCKALTQINVTEATTDIDPLAFQYCENLDAINVAKKNPKYSSVDGYLLSKDKKELILFPPGKANSKFTLLPPSITKIGDFSFYNCEKLLNVIIPNKVTAIGKRAFGLCKNLNLITFLCDNVIDPNNINQAQNEMSFDDGSQAPNMFENITIHVRKELYNDFNALPFYHKFKGGIIQRSFLVGTEEYIPVSETAVDLLKTTTQDHTFVLPTSITYEGKDYKVYLIGDYAFQNTTDAVKEVVVKKDIEYIGAQAFVTDIAHKTSTVKNVFFIEGKPTKKMLSTTRFELDDTGDNYSEFASTTNIYVKKSALSTYRTAWKKYVYNVGTEQEDDSPFDFTSQIGYKIKGTPALTNKLYSTFSREFDVDFGDVDDSGNRLFWNATKNCPEVIAFTSGEKIGNSIIRMQSINLGDGTDKDGLYVPANTGVVLKAVNGSLPSDFYYRIGEDDKWSYGGNNILKPVTVNAKDIVATEGGNTNFYISGGKAFRVSQAQQFKSEGKLTIGVHKAYISLNVPSGAKLSLLFNDGETTGIESLNAADTTIATSDNTYYNLNGQRVTKPVKGIYIHNGKKLIVK